MTDINKLKELVETLKPNYGAVGSRDVDVTAKRAAADGIVEALEATEQRVAEITGKYEEVSGWYAKIKTRMLAADAELARRDAAAGEPVYQVGDDGKWYDCKEYLYQEAKERRDACRILYTAAPAALPDDYFSSIVLRARQEGEKAMAKFPQPNYVLLKVAEEAGEVVQAGVHYAEGRETWEAVEGEVVQTIAMLYRLVTEGDLVNGVIPPQGLTVEGE